MSERGSAFTVTASFGLAVVPDDALSASAALQLADQRMYADKARTKPGPLNESEWQFMRQHPLIGERILSVDPALRPVARLVRASHERWDGNGYPDLRGP